MSVRLSSMLEPCALSSACLVSCWSMVFGSWHSCLEFRFRVGVTLALHVLSHCVSVQSRIRSAARYSVHVCFVVLHAVRVFIGCVHSCYVLRVRVLFCTWLVICLLAMCLCFCFVWPHGYCLSFLCAMCSHVNCLDPTHLVSWLLVNLPHLSSLVTLFICSLYNLLVCSPVPVRHQMFPDPCLVLLCPNLPYTALPSQAKPSQALPAVLFFPYGVVFVAVLFYFLFIKIKPILLHNWILGSSLHLHLVILQTLLSKATYNWGIHKAINLKEANRQRICP